jgi:hypothetical protein
MCPAIDDPASCKICAVIHFRHAKNMNATEITANCVQFTAEYVMSEDTGVEYSDLGKQTNCYGGE